MNKRKYNYFAKTYINNTKLIDINIKLLNK